MTVRIGKNPIRSVRFTRAGLRIIEIPPIRSCYHAAATSKHAWSAYLKMFHTEKADAKPAAHGFFFGAELIVAPIIECGAPSIASTAFAVDTKPDDRNRYGRNANGDDLAVLADLAKSADFEVMKKYLRLGHHCLGLRQGEEKSRSMA